MNIEEINRRIANALKKYDEGGEKYKERVKWSNNFKNSLEQLRRMNADEDGFVPVNYDNSHSPFNAVVNDVKEMNDLSSIEETCDLLYSLNNRLCTGPVTKKKICNNISDSLKKLGCNF